MNNFLIVKFVKYLFTLHEGDECGRDHGYPVSVKSESEETWAPILVLVNYVYGQILWLPWVFVCSSGYNTNIIGLLEPSAWPGGQWPSWSHAKKSSVIPNTLNSDVGVLLRILLEDGPYSQQMSRKALRGTLLFPLSLSLSVICRYPHSFVCVHMSVHLSCVHTSVGNEPKAWCKRSKHATPKATPLVQFFSNLNPYQGRVGRHMGTQIPNTFILRQALTCPRHVPACYTG